jgi:hypothetical protein
MLDYISAVDDANALFQDGAVPSVEAYWRRRDYAAGVYPTIATIPSVLMTVVCIYSQLITYQVCPWSGYHPSICGNR